MKKIIYDFGANNGDDIPYYLMKADVVIAVEANPSLCILMRDKFQTAIEAGKLVVENYVLTNQPTAGNVAFYVHKKNHVLSQFPRPNKESIANFARIDLPAITPMDLFDRHGNPYYIKIDIEHFDGEILRCLFENKIYPEYISAESHSPEIFSLLVALGRYNAFKLVDGSSVARTYKETFINALNGQTQIYSFPYHSAGPFGEDIREDWLSGKAMLRKLGLHGCGWKDLHATNNAVETSNFSFKAELCKLLIKKGKKHIKKGKKHAKNACQRLRQIFVK
jgi:FkbM family methyltransferase